ncbi:hypothetical protein [Senegalimassilia anaerobia]
MDIIAAIGVHRAAFCRLLKEGEHPVGSAARVSLPLAGLDREVREMRHHKVDAEEGLFPGQQCLRGLLRFLRVELFYGRSWSGWSVDDFMDAAGCRIHWCGERRIMESLGG